MSRRRNISIDQLEHRILRCKCGEPVPVVDNDVVSVECAYCVNHVRPYSKLSWGQFTALEEKEIREEQVEEMAETLAKKIKHRSGQSKKEKNVESAMKCLESYLNKEARSALENLGQSPDTEGESLEINQKPSKTKATVESEQTSRKSIIGDVITNFVVKSEDPVKFEDILAIYSETRKMLGKKNPDPKIEERNCRSTLYALVKRNRICEVGSCWTKPK